jgi:hypothetical protein
MDHNRAQQIRAQVNALLDELTEAWNLPPPRPAEPSAAWCMIHPYLVRWNGEVRLAPTPWAILRAILILSPDGHAVPVAAIEEIVGHELSDTAVRMAVFRIDNATEKIQWPWDYGFRGGCVVRN